ncbi:MAG: ectoine synthase [Candidatus Methanolliviera hydrocarbonicum]|uniref:L-ectoine synthase n=1 Tax=Candidatus Methanolliviera hydrocarbonicum TaxID=2491085 RepID=A0A520KVP1_9EURY|nr:MAG: ectoine synthase [Candidatus Methanolliviera hydrocarbonicum]
MIVRNIEEIKGSEREVTAENDNWISRRLLLKRDGVVFSLSETIIYEGTETYIWYKNHVEAVYCIEGEGEVELVDNNKVYNITPGTLYVLNKHEKHLLRAKKRMRLVCVFNPPLVGSEVHQEDGSYPLIE